MRVCRQMLILHAARFLCAEAVERRADAVEIGPGKVCVQAASRRCHILASREQRGDKLRHLRELFPVCQGIKQPVQFFLFHSSIPHF